LQGCAPVACFDLKRGVANLEPALKLFTAVGEKTVVSVAPVLPAAHFGLD
jgi:hypothetical protein